MSDKSNHRVTVDREYLEELESSFEQKQTDLNAKVIRTVVDGVYLTLLQTNETNKVMNDIVLMDENGKEHVRYRKI